MSATNDRTPHQSSKSRESLWNGAMLIYFVLSLLFAARAAADIDTQARELRGGEGAVAESVASSVHGRARGE